MGKHPVAIVLVFVMAVVAQSAGAQTLGVVAGVVRDASGAVLPGVTVEAASPALIEKVRTAVDRRLRPVPDRQPAARRVHGDVRAAGLQHGAARGCRA